MKTGVLSSSHVGSILQQAAVALKFFGASLLLVILGLSSAGAQGPWATTSCGYTVTTTATYNSPMPGQTTFTWTVQNTNPGNGSNGTYKDLGHLDQQFGACIDPTARISGGSYGKDPSQSCLTGNVLKFNSGTNGTTPSVYTAVFNSLSYVPVLVNASFKAGNGCCSGQIYGVGCCAVTGGAIEGAQTICSGGDPTVLGSVTSGTANGTLGYQWQSNTVGCSGTFTDISGANGASYDPPAGLTQTTWYRRVTTSSFANGGPSCSDNSNCVKVTATLPTLIGTAVTGSANYCDRASNLFNSSFGFVPAGCSNSGMGSTTVPISNPNNEFCVEEIATGYHYAGTANFDGNTLTVTDFRISNSICPYVWTFQMAPGLVASVTETSDNFTFGGVGYGLVGDVLTLTVPSGMSAGTYTAVYTFGLNCIPNTARMSFTGNSGSASGSEGSSSAGASTRINTAKSTELKLYPNPNSGSFTLSLPYFENQAQITVSNVQGQVIMRKVVNANSGSNVKLDLNNVSRGLYFIEATFGTERVRTMMTVQ